MLLSMLSCLAINPVSQSIATFNGSKDCSPRSSLNCIADQLEDIIDFLDLPNQRNARLINAAFNFRINRLHSDSIDAAQTMQSFVESVLMPHENDDQAQIIQERLHRHWQIKHKMVRYKELYLYLWPRLLEKSLNETNRAVNIDLMRKLRNKASPHDSVHGINRIIATLVASSEILLRILIFQESRNRTN